MYLIYFLEFIRSGSFSKLEAVEANFLKKAKAEQENKDFEKCENIPDNKKNLTEQEKKCRERAKMNELKEKRKKLYAGSFLF